MFVFHVFMYLIALSLFIFGREMVKLSARNWRHNTKLRARRRKKVIEYDTDHR